MTEDAAGAAGTGRKGAFGRALDKLPGLVVCLVIAMASTFVSQQYGGPTLLYALLIGMAFHFLVLEKRTAPGINLAARSVLRLGVALLGARIGLDQVLALGWPSLWVVIAAVAATIAVGTLLSRRLGLGRDRGLLTGGAVAICGASAALAISAVLPPRPTSERDTLFTVVAVTTLSTVAMILYPLLVRALALPDATAGIFLGGTIHDVAQVVGAGYIISQEAGDAATLTKLFRVALLVPAVFVIGLVAARGVAAARRGEGRRMAPPLPGFLVGFVALVALNTLGLVPAGVAVGLGELSRWFLVTAIAAIGIKTSFAEFRSMGWKPLALVVAETLFVAGFVFAGLWLVR